MENKKGISIVFIIIALIVGSALYRQFDSKNSTFEKPALAVLYSVVFLASLYFIVKGLINRSEK